MGLDFAHFVNRELGKIWADSVRFLRRRFRPPDLVVWIPAKKPLLTAFPPTQSPNLARISDPVHTRLPPPLHAGCSKLLRVSYNVWCQRGSIHPTCLTESLRGPAVNDHGSVYFEIIHADLEFFYQVIK